MPLIFVRGTKRPGAKKTESLTLRLDPKTKFQLELVARAKRQSVTEVIESLVRREVEALRFPRAGGGECDWSVFWSPEQHERLVLLLSVAGVELSGHEQLLSRFIAAHAEFFFEPLSNPVTPRPSGERTRVLWPRLQGWAERWDASRGAGDGAVVEEMRLALTEAGLSMPDAQDESAAARQRKPKRGPTSQAD